MARNPNPKYLFIVNEAHGDTVECLVDQIDPSPYQNRRYFDETALKELAQSIETHGLIQPITVRFKGERFELICGERRFRAVRDYCTHKALRAQIMTVDDDQARAIVAHENIQRENLSPLETMEAVATLVDSALLNTPHAETYRALGEMHTERLNTLMKKLDYVERAIRRGESVGPEAESFHHKFVVVVTQIFNDLPKPLKWKSFFTHYLPNLLRISPEVAQIVIRWRLNHSLIESLQKLYDVNPSEIQNLRQSTEELESLEKQGIIPQKPGKDLRKLTAKAVNSITKRYIAKKSKKTEPSAESSQPYSREIGTRLLKQLGKSATQIWEQPGWSRTQVEATLNDTSFAETIRSKMEEAQSVSQIAIELECPESLVWAIHLEGETDDSRLAQLGWRPPVWDRWFWRKPDLRFGRTAKVPDVFPQLIASLLFYASQIGQMVVDPFAWDAVLPDVCLALGRHCRTFSPNTDFHSERFPDLTPYTWDFDNPLWPDRAQKKANLILLRPHVWQPQAYDYGMLPHSWEGYLTFLQSLLQLAYTHAKNGTQVAFLITDQPAPEGAAPGTPNLFVTEASRFLSEAGWTLTHLVDCPIPGLKISASTRKTLRSQRQIYTSRRTLLLGKK